jgi:hypothetical protein
VKTKQKFLILYCAFLISFLPACVTTHESANQSQMSFNDATNSMKGAISDARDVTGVGVAITDVAISEKGFTLFLNNKEKSFLSLTP